MSSSSAARELPDAASLAFGRRILLRSLPPLPTQCTPCVCCGSTAVPPAPTTEPRLGAAEALAVACHMLREAALALGPSVAHRQQRLDLAGALRTIRKVRDGLAPARVEVPCVQ